MLERMKQKIKDLVSKPISILRLNKKERYYVVKQELENLLSLQSHDEWKLYEDRLFNRLYQRYMGLSHAKDIKDASFLQGCIYELEGILDIPRNLKEKEKYLKEELKKDDNKRADRQRMGRKVQGVVSI